jgi:hypothetical protein
MLQFNRCKHHAVRPTKPQLLDRFYRATYRQQKIEFRFSNNYLIIPDVRTDMCIINVRYRHCELLGPYRKKRQNISNSVVIHHLRYKKARIIRGGGQERKESPRIRKWHYLNIACNTHESLPNSAERTAISIDLRPDLCSITRSSLSELYIFLYCEATECAV